MTTLKKIVPPSNCPSCDSDLVWTNHILYCVNDYCLGKTEKKLEHFSKTLKIKGLGPASIAKLGIESPAEIFSLTQEDLEIALSSEKLADKLHKEIQNAVSAPLELVLPAFGIPLIGSTATKKLAAVTKSISDIRPAICREAGLGPKATENLMNWLEHELVMDDYPFTWEFTSNGGTSTKKGAVCISGKLKSFKTKADATKVLNDLGYEVKSSLTKDVTILVNESGLESSKTKKARETGVTIVTDLHKFMEIN